MDETKPPIRLRVVSDGTPRGTQVIDSVSGRQVEGLTALVIRIDAKQPMSTVTLEMEEGALAGLDVVGALTEVILTGGATAKVATSGKGGG